MAGQESTDSTPSTTTTTPTPPPKTSEDEDIDNQSKDWGTRVRELFFGKKE